MTLREKVLSMRMNEFGLQKVANFFHPDRDLFPNKIHVVKWVNCEPTKVYSVEKKEYTTMTCYSYVIGQLMWNSHEPCWEFKSVGTRYLEVGTEELNKWLMDFCNRYEVVEGELVEVGHERS